MSYTTNWISTLPSSDSPRRFLWSSLRHYLQGFRPRHFVRAHRTPDTVRQAYDANRSAELERLESLDWDSYVYFPPDLSDFVLLDDEVRWGALRAPRTRLLERLTRVASRYAVPGATIIEFGSGDGRNVLHLKKAFPGTSFIGLELSEVSVDLSRKAARKFGIAAEFFQANVCEALPRLPDPGKVTLAYSSFALEMMPRIFVRAVDHMAASTSGGLAFFEPVGELWPRNLRGVSSRLRVFQMDRLRGLAGKVRSLAASGEWEVITMERTRIGINPLNEGCEIHLRRSL
jgi:hypothetical protein